MAAYYTYNFLPPVSSDFDSLLHDFEQQSTFDYQTFANVWRQHKLQLLFKAADVQPNSFRFFLDDSLTVAAAYLGGTWRLPIQIGALYTIFTIYMYQLEEPKIKIRLTLETCKSFLDQIESSNDVPADAKTILCKLLDEHAFVLSATRHEMGPRFFTKINYMKSGKYMRSDVLLSSRMTVDEKLVQLCEETHNLYSKAKDSLIEAYGGADQLPAELMSIRPNFIEQLKSKLDLDRHEDASEENSQPTTDQPRRSSVGEARRRIRAQAEKMSLSTMKSEFFDDDEDEDEDTEFRRAMYADDEEDEDEEDEEQEQEPNDNNQRRRSSRPSKKTKTKPIAKPKPTRRSTKKKTT